MNSNRTTAIYLGLIVLVLLTVSSLVKSYRVKSHKVVPVKSSHSITSRQVDLEKGNAS